MTHNEIINAFKRWGDIKAAARNSGKKTFGGHGNGGKFYMRSAFETSRFITYRNGRLNVYGFNKRNQYGFQENYENVKISSDAALKLAEIDASTLPESARKRLEASQGFTVVIGERPQQLPAKCDRAEDPGEANAASAGASSRGASLDLWAHLSAQQDWELLRAYDPEPRPDFPEPIHIEVPAVLKDENGDDVILRDEEWPEAFLDLSTSKDSLRNTGINRLDVIGEIGAIASYDVTALGLPNHPAHGDFIFGELFCPKLEDPAYKCVANDREKLIENEKTRALLKWARDQFDQLAGLADADAKQRKHADLSQSSAFNELLNQWKNKFMPTLMAQLFGGSGEGSGFGGTGAGAGGLGEAEGTANGRPNESDDGPHAGDEGGGGDELKQGRRAPTVLLSGQDPDPLDLMAPPLELSPRQPGVYQRLKDVEQGVYWINTSRPLAERILDELGAESTRWRDYLFQRYVEIILKESIHELEKTEGDLSADRLQGHIDSLYTSVYDHAYDDLQDFLSTRSSSLDKRGPDARRSLLGIGGFTLGFEASGAYRTILMADSDYSAALTFKRNRPRARYWLKDLRRVEASAILGQAGCGTGELDVLTAGPPCQGLSKIGRDNSMIHATPCSNSRRSSSARSSRSLR